MLQDEWRQAIEDNTPKAVKETPTIREEILAEARALISNDRNAQYGPPAQDFQRTAAMLSSLWDHKLKEGEAIEAHDIAVMLAVVKLSRIQWSPHKKDSWVDLAGYAACGAEAYAETFGMLT